MATPQLKKDFTIIVTADGEEGVHALAKIETMLHIAKANYTPTEIDGYPAYEHVSGLPKDKRQALQDRDDVDIYRVKYKKLENTPPS